MTCTLTELAFQLAAEAPSALPYPAIGTRLGFRLVFRDTRNAGAGNSHHSYYPRFAVKDLGSIVIGEGGPGVPKTNIEEAEEEDWDPKRFSRLTPVEFAEAEKTLGDAKFVVGDYISCAILPPLEDGSVAPPMSPQREGRSVPTGPGRGGGRGQGSRENGISWPSRGRREGGPRGGRSGWEGVRDSFPSGEWRRGEDLPDPPPGKPRRRGRR